MAAQNIGAAAVALLAKLTSQSLVRVEEPPGLGRRELLALGWLLGKGSCGQFASALKQFVALQPLRCLEN
ncbi:hypothetical protein P3T76_010587 [Phytophthora citrophthora]|uniref:Uncharacterized protein n=1 Tax=Phytophthora citrophthora TaxID=4793 RepID=A0AAD9LH31_9STRA|nr:hypothetical protein P3T76_010587 [Phytophthora citrophthora]